MRATSRAFSEQFFHWETALRFTVKNLMRGMRTHEMRATKNLNFILGYFSSEISLDNKILGQTILEFQILKYSEMKNLEILVA